MVDIFWRKLTIWCGSFLEVFHILNWFLEEAKETDVSYQTISSNLPSSYPPSDLHSSNPPRQVNLYMFDHYGGVGAAVEAKDPLQWAMQLPRWWDILMQMPVVMRQILWWEITNSMCHLPHGSHSPYVIEAIFLCETSPTLATPVSWQIRSSSRHRNCLPLWTPGTVENVGDCSLLRNSQSATHVQRKCIP